MVPRRMRPFTPSLATGIAILLSVACSGGGGGTEAPALDTTPPSAPAALTATPTSATTAVLSWSASSDDVGVTRYEVLRDGAVILTTAATAASDAGLAPLTRYCWAARARDAAGNVSASCPEACATTPAPLDIAPPSVVETTPPDGATDVAPSGVFTARFDEAVAPATLAAGGGFTLRDGGGALVSAAVTWDAPSLTATLTPSAPLANLGSYTATVGTAVTDLAGKPLVAPVSWTIRVAPKALALQRAAGGGLGAPCAPTRIATADFDQDSHVDVAFVCGESHVWVTRGDGAGGFAAATGVAIGPRPGYGSTYVYGVAAADLDGDGYPDLAVAEAPCDVNNSCLVNGYVDVVLNAGAAASGTFGTPVPLVAGMYPVNVVAADLDGDGHVDLASVERWSNRLSVFLATGGGAFAAAVPYDAPDPVTLVAAALRPGGPLDLVPSGGPVLLGDGRGGFAPATGAFAPGPYPMDVAAADLDGDGNADLVVANDGTDHVTVLRGDGTGAFPSPTTLQTGQYPVAVVAADLNGDGWPDLLVVLRQNGGVGTDTTLVLLGVGGGDFAPPIMLGDRPFAVADLNGDGKPDLVGTHLSENPFGFVLDVWLNVTP